MALVSFFLTLALAVGSSQTVNATFKHGFSNLSYAAFDVSSFRSLLLNDALPVSESASVTIFTHGMSSGNAAADWYTENNAVFSGLPFEISESVFSLTGDDDGIILSGVGQTITNGEYLVPAGNHLSLVYNANFNDAGTVVPHTDLYNAFEKRVDRFLKAYYDVFHVVPKINLIGHSRGGLINMMYAINYPFLVSNLLSVGTPYVGSDWAKVLCGFYHAVAGNNAEYPYDEVAGTSFAGQYADDWNAVASESSGYGINTLAVGFSIDKSIIADSMRIPLLGLYDYVEDLINEHLPGLASIVTYSAWSSFVDLTLSCLLEAAAYQAYLTLEGLFNTAAFAATALAFFSGVQVLQTLSALLNYIFNLVVTDLIVPAWAGGAIKTDLAVEVSSQMGKDRAGNQVFDLANAWLVAGTLQDYGEPSRTNISFPWAPHNHEAKNPLVRDAFLEELESDPSYLHSHDFELRTPNNRHVLDCDCGAVFHDCNGPYTRQPVNTLQHLESCSACDFARLRPHSWAYTHNQNGHHAHCQECDISLSFQPHDYACRDMNANQHIYICACGRSYTGSHFFVNGRCRECNRTQGSGGGIMPL